MGFEGTLAVMAVSLIIIILIPLSARLIIKHVRDSRQGNLLLNGRKCLMDRREYDLFNTIMSVIDRDKYTVFYAVPFNYIFSQAASNPGPKASKLLSSITADFLICESKDLKPSAIILLDYDINALNLITADIKIINMPSREFYTRKDVETTLMEFSSAGTAVRNNQKLCPLPEQ